MKHKTTHCAKALRPVVAWAGAAILSLGALFGATNASAVAPPAKTLIGNVASASYLDSTGTNMSAKSNEVQTQVQQVGAFLLDTVNQVTTTVINSKTGAANAVVYAAHTLTNTGNDADGFDIKISNGPNGGAGLMSTQVFLDANFDGLPDNTTPLCTAVAGATCTVPTQTVAGNGGVLGFVVAYTIPAGATQPAVAPFSSGLVTATPVTTAVYTAPNTSAADVDNVNVTTQAAFSATKSLSIPTVNGPGNVAYPTATQSGPRSVAGCSTASFAAASSPAAGCVYSTYTIKFQNTGAVAGAFYLNDVLPNGFTYVTGTAVWSGASGVALTEASGEPTAGIDFQQSSQTVSALIANVNPNVASSISFMVLVNPTATIGTGLTTNTATYDPTAATHVAALTGPGAANTNASAFTVIASFGVTLGSSTGALPGSTDTVPGVPRGTFGTNTEDQNLAAGITSGGSVKFTQKLFNTGNAADTFNMTALSSSFPAGTVFTFFQADGSTPLIDTNSDGIVDTGSIAGGTVLSFVVKATIPAATAVGAGPFAVTVRATSVGDSTKFDASGDQVTAVTGVLVDMTNSLTGSNAAGTGDVGTGPSTSPTTITPTTPGVGVVFPLFIKNNDAAGFDQTYSLAASQTTSFPGSLPAGWTVKFIASGTGACTDPEITSISVAVTVQAKIGACVTPPASAVAGTTNVFFRVTSTLPTSTGAVVSDTKLDAVTVSAAVTHSAILTPNGSGQLTPGGTVVYAHTLNNTGNQACGVYSFTATQSGAATNWKVSLFLDANGNGIIDGTDPVVSNPSAAGLAVGGSQKILVRVNAPGGAALGDQDTVVVTATFAALGGGTCGPTSATDISTIVTGSIRVTKSQVIDAACDGTADGAFSADMILNAKPGQCVMYRVTATNEGTAAVTNLSINDALPVYTSLTGAIQPAAATQCVASTGITGTTPVFATTASMVSCGSANTVAPGANLQLNFAVRINP